MNSRRFWIRRDREQYFLSGVIITCVIGGFVSSYWHFTDRITVHQNIKMKKTVSAETRRKQLKEVQYAPAKLGKGAKRYYRLDPGTIPSVPRLGENESD